MLDPKSDTGAPGGRIWLVDPETGKVMGDIRTGDNPDFALSPDGSRLYVASITDGDSSELAVIDTAQGVVLQRATIEDREVANVLPPFSAMAVSGDGLALRILLDTPKSADADAFLLATFDTQTGEFLRRSVHLGNCGPGRFISYPTAEQFDFLCPRTNRVRLIRVDADSRELQNLDVVLPWERRVGAAEAIEAPGDQDIAIVRGDGAVVKMNVATQEFADTAAHPVLPNRVPPAAWPISPDGSRVYLGYNSNYDRSYDNRFYLDYGRPPNLRPNDATAAEFRVLDTRTWKKIGTIKTKMPFWSAVIANDGNDALCDGSAEAQYSGDRHREDAREPHPQGRRSARAGSYRPLSHWAWTRFTSRVVRSTLSQRFSRCLGKSRRGSPSMSSCDNFGVRVSAVGPRVTDSARSSRTSGSSPGTRGQCGFLFNGKSMIDDRLEASGEHMAEHFVEFAHRAHVRTQQ